MYTEFRGKQSVDRTVLNFLLAGVHLNLLVHELLPREKSALASRRSSYYDVQLSLVLLFKKGKTQLGSD